MALIKHRPKIQLLAPREVYPGHFFDATIVITARREVEISHLDVVLAGTETGTIGSGQYSSRRSWEVCRQALRLREALTIPPGRSEHRCRLRVPAKAPPSYHGPNGQTRYLVSVRLAIPWWPDASSEFEINVGLDDKRVASPPGEPLVFSTSPTGPRAREPHVEGSLAGDVLPQGGVLAGAVALGNVEFNSYKGVVIALCGSERISLPRQIDHNELARYQIYLPCDDLIEGRSFPFRMRLPERLAPSFASRLWTIGWEVELTIRIRWGRDLVLRVPVTVIPARFRALESKSYRAPPDVGSARAEAVWTAVAQRHGLTFHGATMHGDVAGVSVTIRREHQGRRGVFLVAELGYPSLDLDLAVQPRGRRRGGSDGALWSDRWQAKHRVEAREPDQLAALAERIRDPLDRLGDATIHDNAARFQLRSGGVSHSELDSFTEAAVVLARGLDEARRAIPPPAAMAPALDRWRHLAADLDGELTTAKMAIECTLGGNPAAIRTEWLPDGSPLETQIELRPTLPLAVDLLVRPSQFASLPVTLADHPAAAALISRAVAGEVRSLELRRDLVAVTLPAPVSEPAWLAGRLRLLAELARALASSAPPYR